MKTKYVKVSITDKPKGSVILFSIEEEGKKSVRVFDDRKRRFYGASQPEYYLKEVPDHEEEMREILQYMLENGFCVDKHGED
jgi:hypothetical protein